MSDTPPPLPTIGQEAWGDELNAYLTWVSTTFTAQDDRINALEGRVAELEAEADYAFTTGDWMFSNAAPPATGAQLRLNDPVGSLATYIDFRNIDNGGVDRTALFSTISAGDLIRIQDFDASPVFYRYVVSGPATIGASNTQVPVTWHSGAGVVPNAKCNVIFAIAATP